MSTLSHRKLVRDRVPTLIRSRGEEPVTRVLDADEFTTSLLQKFVEEAGELRDADPDKRLDELADVWEVLTTLAADLHIEMADIATAASLKRIVRGGFEERIWLECTTTEGEELPRSADEHADADAGEATDDEATDDEPQAEASAGADEVAESGAKESQAG